MGRGGACVPARVACRGASIVKSPCTMRIFLAWKRRCADVWAGTQAPPLRFRLVDCVWAVGAVWGNCAWTVGFVWVDCVWVVLFVCWENGAHKLTPSVLYFYQPRVADDRRLPWVKSWRGTYAIGIVLFKINFRMGKSFANNPFAACDDDV